MRGGTQYKQHPLAAPPPHRGQRADVKFRQLHVNKQCLCIICMISMYVDIHHNHEKHGGVHDVIITLVHIVHHHEV